MDRPWFDQETDVLLIDEYIVEMDSYKRIVEDGKITDTELLEQTLRVVTLLQAARRGALAGGQSPGHRGFWRDGGAQRPAGASPAGFFGAAVITQPAEKIPPEVQAQRTATYVHERRHSRWVLSTLPRPFPTSSRTSLPLLRT